MAKRAKSKTSPLGTKLYRIPRGSFYRSTAADGALGEPDSATPKGRGTASKRSNVWETGQGERMTVQTPNGPMNIGPNTVVNQALPQANWFQELMRTFTGYQAPGYQYFQPAPSGAGTIRGSTGGFRASPVPMGQTLQGSGTATMTPNALRTPYPAYTPSVNQLNGQNYGPFRPQLQGSGTATARPYWAYGPQLPQAPVIQTGYQDYGQRLNRGQGTPTNALPTTNAQPAAAPVSRAQGRAQFLSGEGLNPESDYIPTRGDVWEMKARARRRRMSRMSEDEVGSSGGVAQPKDNENKPNQVTQSGVNWRIRG